MFLLLEMRVRTIEGEKNQTDFCGVRLELEGPLRNHHFQ